MRVIKEKDLLREGIILEKGKEYEESIFKEEFKQAFELVDEIVKKNQEVKEQKKNRVGEYVNERISNVISFVGDRGTGKTSAMLSVWNHLREDAKEYRYIALPYIDAGTLKSEEDVISIILSRMLQYLMDMIEENYDHQKERTRDLYKGFDDIYKHLLNLNTSERDRLVEGESALRMLRNLTSSYSVAEELKRLVTRFLEYMREKNECCHQHYLVIALDDLDLYQIQTNHGHETRNVYTLLECIYEYLMIPGVIVLATYNMEVLQKKCENYLNDCFSVGKICCSAYDKSKDSLASMATPINRLLDQFLKKIVPSHQRIYMPNYERVDYANADGGLFVRPEEAEDSECELVKIFMLKCIAKYSGIYFDAEGIKKHFFEPRNLRTLYDMYIFVCSLKKYDFFNSNLEGKKFLYKKMLDYVYNQFEGMLLNSAEHQFFERLLEVNMERRSRNIIEYVRERRHALPIESPYYYPNDKKDWKYSYGELLYNLYCSTRCGVFTKEMIHCILASYSVVLNREYTIYTEYRWKYKRCGKDQCNDLQKIKEQLDKSTEFMKGMLGTSITGGWSNNMLPKVMTPTSSRRSVMEGTEKWENTPQEIGSVSINNFEHVGVFDVSEGIVIKLLGGDVEHINWDDEDIKNFIRSLELLWMFFSNKSQGGNTGLDFVFEGNAEKYEIKMQKTKECFNIMNFVVNSFFYEEFYENMSKAIVTALVRLWESRGIKQIKNEEIRNAIKNHSLYSAYEKWENKHGTSLAIPVQHFDMTYNIIKRQADAQNNGMPLTIEVDDVLKYCNKVYSGIGEKLKRQDEKYNSGSKFGKIYEECPFVVEINRLTNKEEENLGSYFCAWLKETAKKLGQVANQKISSPN